MQSTQVVLCQSFPWATLTSASRVTSCQPCMVTAQVPASLLSGEQRRRIGVLHSVWAHRVRYGSSTGVSHHSPPAEMHPNPPPSTGTPPTTSCSLPENSLCLSDMWLPAIAGSSCHPVSCQTRCPSLNKVHAEARSMACCVTKQSLCQITPVRSRTCIM